MVVWLPTRTPIPPPRARRSAASKSLSRRGSRPTGRPPTVACVEMLRPPSSRRSESRWHRLQFFASGPSGYAMRQTDRRSVVRAVETRPATAFAQTCYGSRYCSMRQCRYVPDRFRSHEMFARASYLVAALLRHSMASDSGCLKACAPARRSWNNRSALCVQHKPLSIKRLEPGHVFEVQRIR
jgi:hypothetical protein